MDSLLSKLELDQWYKLLGVACGLGWVAAVGTNSNGWALVAFGGLIFSAGVWKDHQTYSAIQPATFSLPATVRSKNVHAFTATGALMNLAGIGITIWGLTRL